MGRYCTKTKKLELSLTELRESEERMQADLKDSKTKVYTQKQSALSSTMKERIDTLLANFIAQLKGKSYSDEQIVKTIDTVLERLEAYRNDERYKDIIFYMEEVLQEYRSIYDDPLEQLE